MDRVHKSYLPAAGHDLTLPFYDPLVKLLGGDRVRAALLADAALEPKQRVLDIGCGTGTLLVLLKRLHPAIEAVGLDPDPKALARSQRKARQAGYAIRFDRGYSDALPYEDGSFDRVFSSFMFHHLKAEDRARTLREALRVLKPGGSLHLLDFTRSKEHPSGGLMRMFHGSHRLEDNSESRIMELLKRAGFAEVKISGKGRLLFRLLTTSYFRALVPVSSAWPREG